MEVSPSRLKVFGECANQYRYQYLLQLDGAQYGAYTALGVVFHYALEVYELYGRDLTLAVRTFDYYWDHPTELDTRIDFYPPRTTHQGLRENAHEMLERYHDLYPWKTGKLVGTEIRFEVPIGPHTLRGVIDKLFYRPGAKELQVIDFKTGNYVPTRLRYNLQFTCYLYAVTRPEFWTQVPGWEDFWSTATGLKVQGQWYHARNGKMFNAGFRNDSDYKRLLLAIDRMEQAIDSDIYPLTIEGTACGWCSWVDICGTEVDSPNQDLEESLMDLTGESKLAATTSDN